MFSKNCIFVLLLSLSILCIRADTSCATQNTWSQSINPSALTTLQVTFPSVLNVVPNYYTSTTGTVDVQITACSQDVADSDVSGLVFALSTNSNNVALSVNLPAAGSTTSDQSAKGVYPSSAHRGVTTNISFSIITIALTSLFVLPKNRLSLLLLLAAIALVYSIPQAKATSPITLTVNIGVPATITSICTDSDDNCNPWTDSSSTTDSSSVGEVGSSSTTGSGSTTTGDATAPSTTTTTGSVFPPAGSVKYNLRILILASSISVTGVDFVQLAFDSVGMPYDLLAITSQTDLSAQLSTSGTGLYSGIVTVSSSLLSTAQSKLITTYQQTYGVKWAIVGSTPSAVSGVTAGSKMSGSFDITLAPEMSKFAACLQPTISVSNSYTINWASGTAAVSPAVISDTTNVIPALMATPASGSAQVAAVVWTTSSGTQQLHYFVDQMAQYMHSRAFAPLLVNWISPAGIFIGARRLTFVVQADDLFLASNMWNISTHSNQLVDSQIYRLSADDLQNLADFYENLNKELPTGSNVKLEWPVNGGGVNTYDDPDELYAKAQTLIDSFFYLSHTWDHPCDLDNGTYAEMNGELVDNINFEKTFFPEGLASPVFSNSSMITPCVTGLFNGQVLQAMSDNGITACVGDNSVADEKPTFAYHGYYTTQATNGFDGIFIVPREALDIYYDCVTPEQLVDEYTHNYPTLDATFESIMTTERVYGIEDKIVFRHDPFMFHQANGGSFTYDDPVSGETITTSMVTLWTQRVINELMTYFNLPIVSPKMDDLVNVWKQRLEMDTCGLTVTLTTNDGEVLAVDATSTSSCVVTLTGVSLSGSTVEMETLGVETTAYIALTANQPQEFILSTPLAIA